MRIFFFTRMLIKMRNVKNVFLHVTATAISQIDITSRGLNPVLTHAYLYKAIFERNEENMLTKSVAIYDEVSEAQRNCSPFDCT